ncbi:MAG: hypothetical protein RL220_1327 [Bacteroidota bacterium]
MKTRAILIDDEKSCIETLSWQIKTYCPDVTVVAVCQNAREGVQAIQQNKPDIVFLDIEMPRMNGFEMLEQFEEIDFEIVFTTAYDQFAINAFRYSALNYLLKPVDPDDLVLTLKRFHDRTHGVTKGQIDLLLEAVTQRTAPAPQRLALSMSDGMIFVEPSEIMYCQADRNYSLVKLVDGKKVMVSKSLKEFDETLPSRDFFRVHNSYLINLNQIRKFVRGDGGYVVMNDGTEVTVARLRRDEFFALFDKF